ncbi:PAS domain-containing sensor histidine kinase [Telluribacter humicola]|uniref:PAS domain-containing sensor histidine kinase n=1 Tax=Telluribacter humicola TaxID=1720261 RepID=UPI001A968623|nr:PAS domain-containing sensor histidine kinase [Telluribacter humicola]
MDSLLDQAPGGIFSFTDDNLLQDVNESFCDMLEYSKEELHAHAIEKVFSLSARIFYQTHFFLMLKMHGKAEEIFLNLKAKSGDQVPVLLNARRIEQNGMPLNVCVCICVPNRGKYEAEILEAKKIAEKALNENTELVKAKAELQKQAEELDHMLQELQERNDELMQFSHIISHDLQEPLRKMMVFAEVLTNEHSETESPRIAKASERITKVAAYMKEVLYSLQQYVWLNESSNIRKRVNLERLIQVTYYRAGGILEDNAFDCSFELDGLPVIHGDPGQLEMLFDHLFENAGKYRSADRPLHVTVTGSVVRRNRFKTVQGRYKYVDFVKVLFTDNGIGFEKEFETYVFQLFKKLDTNTSGLGVGLSLCKKIVQNHFGTITASSEPGLGTTFTIMLPVLPDEEA